MYLLIIFTFLFGAPFFIFRPKDPFQPELILNAYYIGLIGIGPVILKLVAPGIYDGGRFDQISFLIGLGFLCINLGFAFTRVVGACDGMSTGRVGEWVGWMAYYQRTFRFVIASCLTVGLIGGFAYFVRAGQIPLFQEDKDAARVAALAVHGNGYFFYLMTVSMIAVLVAAVRLYGGPSIHMPGSQRRKEWGMLAFTLAVGAGMLLTGSRRYTLTAIIYLILVRHYLYKRLKLGWVFVLGFGGFVAINLFEMFRDPNSATTVSFASTSFYRFIIYISNFQKVFQTFSATGQRMLGSTFFMDLATILPGHQQDYQSWLKDETGLTFEGFGIPPTIVGDMFINFGPLGVIVGCFIFGVMARWIYDKL
ncbi:MAG TPA: oligosaccharide repeat unit polymerase, partial [Terracidiphilus sp.]